MSIFRKRQLTKALKDEIKSVPKKWVSRMQYFDYLGYQSDENGNFIKDGISIGFDDFDNHTDMFIFDMKNEKEWFIRIPYTI